jgi:CRP/FNR family transcriptional regulator, cyclic AMP receptor protein
MEGIDEFLQTVSLFQDLDKKHRNVIAKTVFSRKFNAGEAIVREGEPGVGAFMIRSGKVEVTKESGDETEHLNTLGPGEVFGEIALLTDLPRTATVRALEPTEVLGLTAWNFRAELQKSPELAYQLLRVTARRLADADARLAAR